MQRYGYTTEGMPDPVDVKFQMNRKTWDAFEKECLDKGFKPHQILRNCIYNYVTCSIDIKKKAR